MELKTLPPALINFVCLLLLSSCLGEKGSLHFEAKGTNIAVHQGATSFEELKIAVLLPGKCINCHASFNEEKNILEFSDGVNVEGSRFYQVLRSGAMPIGLPPLDSRQLEIVSSYIESVSFEKLKVSILEPKNCLLCHQRMEKEINIQDWVNKDDPEASKIYLRTKDGSMPLGREKLNDMELEMILKYVSRVNSLVGL